VTGSGSSSANQLYYAHLLIADPHQVFEMIRKLLLIGFISFVKPGVFK
jgi:hypothetical protein